MFIAGVSAGAGEQALKLWHLRNATSFNGCLKEVYINAKLVDFLQAAKSRHKVAPGCNMYQDEQPEPEALNPCRSVNVAFFLKTKTFVCSAVSLFLFFQQPPVPRGPVHSAGQGEAGIQVRLQNRL